MEIRGGHVHSNPNLSHRFSLVLLSLPMSIEDENTAHLLLYLSVNKSAKLNSLPVSTVSGTICNDS